MGSVLQFMNEKGCIMERFFGIVHGQDTCSLTLKVAIDSPFYVWVEWTSWSLILYENPSAYHIHCFAHQFTLVVVAIEEEAIQSFFDQVRQLINIVGSSCKFVDKFHKMQLKKVNIELNNGKFQSGQG